MPGRTGHYDLQAILEWKTARPRDPASAEVQDQAEVRQRLRLAEMQAAEIDVKRKQLRYDEESRRLVEKGEVQNAVIAATCQLHSRLLALPTQIAFLVPQELRATIKRMVEEAVRLGWKEAVDAEIVDAEIGELILDAAERLKSDRAGVGG